MCSASPTPGTPQPFLHHGTSNRMHAIADPETGNGNRIGKLFESFCSKSAYVQSRTPRIAKLCASVWLSSYIMHYCSFSTRLLTSYECLLMTNRLRCPEADMDESRSCWWKRTSQSTLRVDMLFVGGGRGVVVASCGVFSFFIILEDKPLPTVFCILFFLFAIFCVAPGLAVQKAIRLSLSLPSSLSPSSPPSSMDSRVVPRRVSF